MTVDSNPKFFICIGGFVSKPAEAMLPTTWVRVQVSITPYTVRYPYLYDDADLILIDAKKDMDDFYGNLIDWKAVETEGRTATRASINQMELTDSWPHATKASGLSFAGRMYLQLDFAERHKVIICGPSTGSATSNWPPAAKPAGGFVSFAYAEPDKGRYIGFRAKLKRKAAGSHVTVDFLQATTGMAMAEDITIDLTNPKHCDVTQTHLDIFDKPYAFPPFRDGDPVGTERIVFLHLDKANLLADQYEDFAGPKLPFWLG